MYVGNRGRRVENLNKYLTKGNINMNDTLAGDIILWIIIIFLGFSDIGIGIIVILYYFSTLLGIN